MSASLPVSLPVYPSSGLPVCLPVLYHADCQSFYECMYEYESIYYLDHVSWFANMSDHQPSI